MVSRIVYISLLLALTVACGDSSTFSADSSSEITSIASLRDIESNYRSILISESIVVEGYVVGNDKYGEFSNCLIIEDQTAALKIIFEADDNYQLYPFGCSVRLYCSGLYLLNSYGSINIGAEPLGDYTLDYIDTDKLGQYLKVNDQQESTLPQPLAITIDQLTPLHAYRYVELQDASIINSDNIDTFCSRDVDSGRTIDTSHTIVDENHDTMELFVDRLCKYADAQLPTERCTLQVIIEYFDSEYSATITNYGVN